MTSTKPDEFRDPRLDEAWRAASQEEPPAALDDAIRAAARREVGAGPRRPEATAAGPRVPEATRPERWWWPLAAAATIGAIAFGLLQLGPSDNRVGDVVSDMSVAEAPPGRGRATEPPRKPIEAATPAEPFPAQTSAAEPPIRVDARQSTAPSAPPPMATGMGTGEQAPASSDRLGAAGKEGRSTPGSPAEATRAPAATAESVALPSAPPAAAGLVASPSAPPATAGSVASPSASPPAANAIAARAPARDTPLAKTASEASADEAATASLVRERERLPVADWIALIRRLRDEGRTGDAARELAAFRAAYPDHEQRLPADLRTWGLPPN